ncbi:D-aminoacyl-tRNA deacylase [Ammoniphilus sp. YIM 78166]|uniref:D-aminoacyl-tRNA deacylase n=1 Tax=Ammoniphilus sp. YIM 78166 TaxID=1644106 RepID=UPI00106F6645|nr:D-aminoacyl-tRNA deacylase [Ammoniphilus sp. YIM 78166]
MRLVVQRSREAEVTVEGKVTGKIDRGLVVLVGITHDDGEEDVRFTSEKVAHLRIFEDDTEKMNHSVLDVGGSMLSISQFTLYGDCRKGRRPNFMAAARPDHAERLYDLFNETLRKMGINVQTGVFGAMMQVHLNNDGPVTIIIDSKEK